MSLLISLDHLQSKWQTPMLQMELTVPVIQWEIVFQCEYNPTPCSEKLQTTLDCLLLLAIDFPRKLITHYFRADIIKLLLTSTYDWCTWLGKAWFVHFWSKTRGLQLLLGLQFSEVIICLNRKVSMLQLSPFRLSLPWSIPYPKLRAPSY